MTRHTHIPSPAEPAVPEATRAAQLRHILQGDLRALALPAQESRAAAPAAPAPERVEGRREGRLGDYLLAHGLISEPDLAEALDEQRQRIARGWPIALGDLLVEKGLLSSHDLVTVLMLQQLDRRQQPATGAEPPLGELLVRAGLITAAQLSAALTVQTEARQRGENIQLGQILIASGALTAPDLASALAEQRRARRG